MIKYVDYIVHNWYQETKFPVSCIRQLRWYHIVGCHIASSIRLVTRDQRALVRANPSDSTKWGQSHLLSQREYLFTCSIFLPLPIPALLTPHSFQIAFQPVALSESLVRFDNTRVEKDNEENFSSQHGLPPEIIFLQTRRILTSD